MSAIHTRAEVQELGKHLVAQRRWGIALIVRDEVGMVVNLVGFKQLRENADCVIQPERSRKPGRVLAEFEVRFAKIYDFHDDEVWERAATAGEAVNAAQAQIAPMRREPVVPPLVDARELLRSFRGGT